MKKARFEEAKYVFRQVVGSKKKGGEYKIV